MRKHIVILILITGVMLLSACGPTEKAIQDAIVKTQTAKDIRATQTAPLPTPTEVPMTYEQAIQEFNNGNFKKAVDYFGKNLQVEDSESYLQKSEVMVAVQGGWLEKSSNHGPKYKAIVSGWDVRYQIWDSVLGNLMEHSFIIQPENVTVNGFTVKYNDWFTFTFNKGDVITLVYLRFNNEMLLSRSDNEPLYLPDIGMTAQQVLDSVYGEPNKVNTTKTASSTSEQWVYSLYDVYIYLENGIVTATQN